MGPAGFCELFKELCFCVKSIIDGEGCRKQNTKPCVVTLSPPRGCQWSGEEIQEQGVLPELLGSHLSRLRLFDQSQQLEVAFGAALLQDAPDVWFPAGAVVCDTTPPGLPEGPVAAKDDAPEGMQVPDIHEPAFDEWHASSLLVGRDPTAFAYPLCPTTHPIHPDEIASILLAVAATFAVPPRCQRKPRAHLRSDVRRQAPTVALVVPGASDQHLELDCIKKRLSTDMLKDVGLVEAVSKALDTAASSEERGLAKKNEVVGRVMNWLLSHGDIVDICNASTETSRLVQKCSELALPHVRGLLREKLEGNVLRLMESKNGNYVVTKLLDCELIDNRLPMWLADFFISEVVGHEVELALTSLGSRLIQRIVSHCEDCMGAFPVLEKLSENAFRIGKSKYGNYIVQIMILRQSRFTPRVIREIMNKKDDLVRDRVGSHVVQTLLKSTSDEVAVEIFDLFKNDASHFCPTKIEQMASGKASRFVTEQVLKVPGTCSGLETAPHSDLVRVAQEGVLHARSLKH